MTSRPEFYVYAVFRPDGSPCYIGMGSGRRWMAHSACSHNKQLATIYRQAGGDLPVVRIRENLTRDQAFEIEHAIISAIGREATGGPLVNRASGGAGGNKGRKQSPEERERRRQALNRPEVLEKMRLSHLGHASPRRRCIVSVATREKLRLSHLGLKQSKETKEKRAAKNRGKKRSAEFSAKQRARSGEKRSDIAREKIGAASRGRVLSAEHKAKIRTATAAALASPAIRQKISDAAKLSWQTRRSAANGTS